MVRCSVEVATIPRVVGEESNSVGGSCGGNGGGGEHRGKEQSTGAESGEQLREKENRGTNRGDRRLLLFVSGWLLSGGSPLLLMSSRRLIVRFEWWECVWNCRIVGGDRRMVHSTFEICRNCTGINF